MKKKQKQNKGFTLVELVVVLVILGILMGMAVPAFTHYIDSQNKKDALTECRQVVATAQSLYMEKYEKNDVTSLGIDNATAVKLAGVNGAIQGTPSFDGLFNNSDGTSNNPTLKITKLSYKSQNGIGVKYDVNITPHYSIEDLNIYTPLEEFIQSYQDAVKKMYQDDPSLTKWLSREEATKLYLNMQKDGRLPQVDPAFLQSEACKKAKSLYWQPYYISTGNKGATDSTLTVLFATPNDGSNPKNIQNSWNAYLVYVNGKVYETTTNPAGIAKLSQCKTEADVIQSLLAFGFHLQE